MHVHYVYWMCLGVSVCERVGGCVSVWVCVCVSVCAVKLGIQSGCWISVVTRMRRWRLAASFPTTLCNQARLIWEDLIILEHLVDISFDSTQRGKEEGREEGRRRGGRRGEWRVKRRGQGVMCVWSGKWEDLGGRINPREYWEFNRGEKNESCAVFGIFKGDPSMAFHAVAKGSVQRTRRLLTGDCSRNPF